MTSRWRRWEFAVEGGGVLLAGGAEDGHGVVDVIFFFGRDGVEGGAKGAGCDLADALITGDGEGFEHYLLDDEAGDEVLFGDAFQEGGAKAFPVPGFDVGGRFKAELAAFGGEGAGVAFFAGGVLECVFDLGGVIADGGECGVVGYGDELAGDGLRDDVLPDEGVGCEGRSDGVEAGNDFHGLTPEVEWGPGEFRCVCWRAHSG